MSVYQALLKQNKQWVANTLKTNSHYFSKLAEGQTPKVMVIGCADSRKPLNIITQTGPGELFIVRNVANQASLKDTGFLAALDYGVNMLKVEHIIVCGHQGCGGVCAAFNTLDTTTDLGKWLTPIRTTYLDNQDEIDALPKTKRDQLLAEINVQQQLHNISESDVMKTADKNGNAPVLHGWLFEISSGLIHEID